LGTLCFAVFAAGCARLHFWVAGR
jgi:hypothetical protein